MPADEYIHRRETVAESSTTVSSASLFSKSSENYDYYDRSESTSVLIPLRMTLENRNSTFLGDLVPGRGIKTLGFYASLPKTAERPFAQRRLAIQHTLTGEETAGKQPQHTTVPRTLPQLGPARRAGGTTPTGARGGGEGACAEEGRWRSRR